MKIVEFGSSRVKVYENGELTNYYSMNLISSNPDEIECKIQDLTLKEGIPDISFFTEWARGNDMIESYINSHNNLGKTKIISSKEEATYFYKIVKQNYPIESIVVDSGGGSVQVCISENILYSFRIGAIYIEKEVIGHIIPYTQQEIEQIRNYIRSELKPVLEKYNNDNLIVGSTKVASFFNSMFPFTSYNEPVNMEELNIGIQQLMSKNYEDIVHIFPEPKGYMYGTLILLITIQEISNLLNAKYIYPTDLNWMQYFFHNKL